MNLEVTEIYNLNDRKFKITVIKKLTKLQECSDSSMNSEIKLMRKRNASSKRLKLLKKASRKSGYEEHN